MTIKLLRKNEKEKNNNFLNVLKGKKCKLKKTTIQLTVKRIKDYTMTKQTNSLAFKGRIPFQLAIIKMGGEKKERK